MIKIKPASENSAHFRSNDSSSDGGGGGNGYGGGKEEEEEKTQTPAHIYEYFVHNPTNKVMHMRIAAIRWAQFVRREYEKRQSAQENENSILLHAQYVRFIQSFSSCSSYFLSHSRSPWN